MKTALVHYWLVRMRGGEAVLQAIMDLYPGADVFTNVYDREGVKALFEGRAEPTATWVDRLPLAKKVYPAYVGLMPGALERLDLNGYDVVVSSEAGPAKWVIPAPTARHICYVHSPMRYLWDRRLDYRAKVPAVGRWAFDAFTARLRRADLLSTMRVDDFVANSSFVAARIERYYRREAEVIHPPVEVADFGSPVAPEDFYLFAGQLVSYKNVRHAVDACVALGRRLVVVGDGPGRTYVESFRGRGVEYRGRVPRAELVSLMSRCRALLFPGVEDFGIIPVEVIAAGRPVIALGQGGVLDSIRHGETGIFYPQATADALAEAIREFEAWEPSFRPETAQARAQAFSPEAFRAKWRARFGVAA